MSGKIDGWKRGYQTLTPEDTEVKLPHPIRVNNKNPAPIQITAEQILQEARQLHNAEFSPPKQKINDYDELVEYRRGKRKQFEDQISRAGSDANIWIDYAEWEDSQKDLERARSVWERALDVTDHRQNHSIWLKYAEFEMNNKYINHARNVWDRAVTILPSVNQLWIKYIHMERMQAMSPVRGRYSRGGWFGCRMMKRHGFPTSNSSSLAMRLIVPERFSSCSFKFIRRWNLGFDMPIFRKRMEEELISVGMRLRGQYCMD